MFVAENHSRLSLQSMEFLIVLCKAFMSGQWSARNVSIEKVKMPSVLTFDSSENHHGNTNEFKYVFF